MLPSDRYLAELLGLTDEQFDYWRDELRKRAAEAPKPAVTAGIEFTAAQIVILVLTAVSIGVQVIGALLAPGAPRRRGAELGQRQLQGRNQTSIQSLAPRGGFDAVQDVAAIGEPIPVIYAHRETIDGVVYGGVRVNATLLWSQIWSLGGSQMLRAVFMVGEGRLAGIDPNGFAIGDSTIGTYDLGSSGANNSSARITIYHRPNGGRIRSANRIAGRTAANDIGNAENDGGEDVFMARGLGNTYQAVFSAASKPSTSTTFGVYGLIGNNLGFKINPQLRPQFTARLRPVGSSGNAIVTCDLDQSVVVQRAKEAAFYSTRSGVISGSFGLGNSFTYRLDRSSDYLTVFQSAAGGATWTSSVVLQSAPKIYEEDTEDRITGFGFADRMTVSSVTIGTDILEVTATFDVDTVRTRLIDENAAAGQYVVEYLIQVDNGLTGQSERQIIQSKFNVTITVQRKGADQYIFEGDVDEDSGPVTALTSPRRLQALIVFPIEGLDAAEETAADVASTVAGRQKAWDDAIVVGDLYKIGSALAICSGRTPSDQIFVSDSEDGADGTGVTIDATFNVVRAGTAATVTTGTITADGLTDTTRQTATSAPHLLRCALGHVSTTNECRIVEVGIRSTLGIRIGGMCNFRDSLTLAEIDGRACLFREGDKIKRGQRVNVDQYQSGVISTSEERYSFFRVSFREFGADSFTQLSPCFGVRSGSDQPTFNYLRLEMPSLNRWELRFEPLTGWEIRSGTATGALVVLDAKLSSSVSGTSNDVTWRANGEIVSRARSQFTITTTRRSPALGLPRPDENNYLDAWGKLAEAFVYEEAQATASNGPEHEIVYINEIRENNQPPPYTGISVVGVNARSAFEWRQFSQLSGYVTGGTEVRRLLEDLAEGPSHLLPDLALDRLTNAKYGPGSVTDDLIGLASFELSAQWCRDRRYFFDGGVIISQESPRQWIADTAGAMLLDFREVGGRYELVPFITFGPVTHKALFTAGNIQEGSFQYESVATEDRQPTRISVKWRQERLSDNPISPGMFPEEREVLVREAAPFGRAGLPMESIDLSDFCTNEDHAIDVAKFTLRMRRLRDHTIRFLTTYDGMEGITTGVGPGDLIRVAMDTTVYDEFNNGVVLADGTVVSTQRLGNGTYSVVSWNGSGEVNDNGTLSIADGIGVPAGIVFTVKRTNAQVRTYQVSRITPTEDGAYEVEAVHMPTNNQGILLVAANWDNEDAWVIE
jgi:hypothetical protein